MEDLVVFGNELRGICLEGFAEFIVDVLGAGRVEPEDLSDFVICGEPCGKACVSGSKKVN